MTDPRIQGTINHLLGAHRRCEHQVRESLALGGDHASADHILALTDCAELCRTTGDLLDRGSGWAVRLTGLAGEVCASAAEQCERLGEIACASVCRSAAEACLSLSEAPSSSETPA